VQFSLFLCIRQICFRWSKIASYFPGRTDNEIKNVWNTHLKKKLVVKKSESSGDESKLESSITSPSSSESFLSNDVPMKDSEKQVSNNELVVINEDPKGSSNSLSSSIESNTILNSSQIVENNNLEQELASLGFYDVDNILEDVDDPNNLIEIPWESDYDLWNFIDNIGTYQSNVGEETVQDVVEAKNWSSHDEFENEFGVVGETKESNNKDEVLPKNYEVEQEIDPQEAFDFNDIIMPDSELDFCNIQLWPSLPQNGIPKV